MTHHDLAAVEHHSIKAYTCRYTHPTHKKNHPLGSPPMSALQPHSHSPEEPESPRRRLQEENDAQGAAAAQPGTGFGLSPGIWDGGGKKQVLSGASREENHARTRRGRRGRRTGQGITPDAVLYHYHPASTGSDSQSHISDTARGGSGAEEERSTTFRSGVEEAHATTTSCRLLAAQAAEEAVRRIPRPPPAAKVAPPRRPGPPPRRPGSFAKGRNDGEPRLHLHRQPPRQAYLWWRQGEEGLEGVAARGETLVAPESP